MSVDDARRVIETAIGARTFPAAAIEVGGSQSVIWSEALGTLTFDPASLPTVIQTPFDLASLTKVIATTMSTTPHAAVSQRDSASSFASSTSAPASGL